MSVVKCDECGGAVKPSESRVAAGVRRRRYECVECKETFTTLEIRLPAGMQSAVLQAKLREWIKQEEAL